MDLNLLRNNSCHPYLNPALLLDNKDPINIKGKDSYMDYLGFAQIFSMDLLEMSYTQEENAVLGEEEEIDLFFTEYQI